MEHSAFRKKIKAYYRTYGRDLPWRKTFDPYKILISEVMLQQTQVSRVILKYGPFVRRFPNFDALARAPLEDILRLWQGLGYNRRALFLKKTSQVIAARHGGRVPQDRKALERFPGIGGATAGAILAYAFDKPEVFMETNIRRVFIHFFFPKRKNVRDREIETLIEKTLDRNSPRQWYWALTDYGAMLGKSGRNPNRASSRYRKQSPFVGSMRQLRGKVLRTLLDRRFATFKELKQEFTAQAERLKKVLVYLEKEGFIRRQNGRVRITP